MSHRPYPPAYLRYLKARLWNLGKPGVWGTALFLSVVGLVIRGYWFNPNVLTSPKNAVAPLNTKSSLSAEEKAIAADIDNLPVLLNDVEKTSLPISQSTPQEDSQIKNSKNLFEDAISQQPSSNNGKSNSGLGIVNDISPSPEKNLFVLQTENILRFGTVDSASQSLGVKSINPPSQATQTAETSSKLGVGLVNQTDKNQNMNSIKPPSQTQSNFNSPTSTQINSSESYGGVMQNFRPNSSTNTSYIQPTVGNQLPSQVQPIPVTNITPYSIQNFKPNAIVPTTPGVSSNFTWKQPTQLPQSNLPVTNGIPSNTYSSP
jgi:hypothetical protein